MKLIDTHCHINTMIKKNFDTPLPDNFIELAQPIIKQAYNASVTKIINVGTSLPESLNCIALAKAFESCYATIGIHPNDVKNNWKKEVAIFKKLLQNSENKIVGIGEIGIDYHYPNFDKILQYDAFKAQIELALEHDLPIVIHTRDAQQEVLNILEQYKSNSLRGIIHCFSEDQAFADRAIALNFVLGIGGTLTYPKNKILRTLFGSIALESIVLETDAPFLPPQIIRGQQNNPAQIKTIAQFLADLRNDSFETIATKTTKTAEQLFGI
jgi:TatD DNase family protein